MGEIPKDYTLRYMTNHQAAMKDMRELAQFLRERLPGPNVTAEQIRERSWWTGPELWVLVDDYDLANTTSGNPLAELVDLQPQAGDIGLHLIITRRMGGAARASFEKVLQMMNDLAVTGILLSGNPSEGAIINGVKPKLAIPGRAQVIHRDLGVVAAQMACTPPTTGSFVDTAAPQSHMIDQSESRRKYVPFRVSPHPRSGVVPPPGGRRPDRLH